MKTTTRRWLLAATAATAVVGCSSGEIRQSVSPDNTGAPTDAGDDAASGVGAESGTLPAAAAEIMAKAPYDDGTVAVLRGRRRQRRRAARQPGRRDGLHRIDGEGVRRRLGLRDARPRHQTDHAGLRHDAGRRQRRRGGPRARGVRRSGARRAQCPGRTIRPHLRRRQRRSSLRQHRTQRDPRRRPARRSRRPRPADRRSRHHPRRWRRRDRHEHLATLPRTGGLDPGDLRQRQPRRHPGHGGCRRRTRRRSRSRRRPTTSPSMPTSRPSPRAARPT